LPGRVVLTRV